MSGPQYKHMIRKMLPRSVSDAYEKFMHFRPFDWMDGTQSFPTRFSIKGADHIKGYRYPAPGSQPMANVPALEADDDPYDTNHFSYDTSRAPLRVQQLYPAKFALEAGESTVAIAAGSENEAAERGSPSGRVWEPVARYDETGLRHAMSASHEQYELAMKRLALDHLSEPEWMYPPAESDVDKDTPAPHRTARQIAMYTKNNGLPALPGVPTKYAGVHGLFMPTDPDTYEHRYTQE
mmetsp:Transcript_8985/g.26110  ORF Transcript_8985/g.26110 Transcript_8985/m.26110 type:complete len:236 (-) Transcript_8985:1610-2317(-)